MSMNKTFSRGFLTPHSSNEHRQLPFRNVTVEFVRLCYLNYFWTWLRIMFRNALNTGSKNVQYLRCLRVAFW